MEYLSDGEDEAIAPGSVWLQPKSISRGTIDDNRDAATRVLETSVAEKERVSRGRKPKKDSSLEDIWGPRRLRPDYATRPDSRALRLEVRIGRINEHEREHERQPTAAHDQNADDVDMHDGMQNGMTTHVGKRRRHQ